MEVKEILGETMSSEEDVWKSFFCDGSESIGDCGYVNSQVRYYPTPRCE